MKGLSIWSSTDTNKLEVNIPDELKGIELQIIILPAEKSSGQQIEFFSQSELAQLSSLNLGTQLDEEDYAKW